MAIAGRSLVRSFSSRRDKAIPTSRYCLNKLRPAGTLAERFPQERNVLGEIAFLDKRVWPNAFHQVVFGDKLPAVFNQRHQNFENFRRKWNELTFAQQDAFRCFEAETTKFIAVTVLLTH